MARQPSVYVVNESALSTGRPAQTLDYGEDDLNFGDETFAEPNSLIKSTSLLLNILKVFGLYFESHGDDDLCTGRKTQKQRPQTVSSTANCESHDEVVSGESKVNGVEERMAKKQIGYNKCRIYSVTVLVLLWANVLRFFTEFDSGMTFDDRLLLKLAYLFFVIVCALNQTSHFVACRFGGLRRFLLQIRITDEFAKRVRRKIAIDTITGALYYSLNIAYFLYIFLGFSESAENDFLSPFTTLVPMPNFAVSIVVHVLNFIIILFLLSAWILPQKVNNVLSFVLHSQFCALRDRFEKDIGANGEFSGSIRTYRRRHQLLCRHVKQVDRFLRISNLAGFGCHSASIILNLYVLIFFPMSSVTKELTFVYFMLCTVFGLVLVTANGIIINEASVQMGERITEIDLFLLKPEDVDELLMFQRRLFGTPIGFSVMGIFVISKNTILSILSVLITYFLMAVRLRKLFSVDTSCIVTVPLNDTLNG